MKSSIRVNKVQTRINKSAALYGNKAANLMELDNLCRKIKNKKIKIQIPEFLPIDNNSIKHHLDTYAIEWRRLWHEFVKVQNTNKTLTDQSKITLKKLRAVIIECFNKHPLFPEKIKAMNLPPDTLFMVRSSGEEDRVDVSNPGGNKSVAAVKLESTAISNAIGVVIASYLSEKSLTQRLLSHDVITKGAFMPVLLQKMIGEKLNGFDDPAKVVISGVMYAKPNGITRLDVAPGHGEIIVNSKEHFDTIEVTPDNIVHPEIHYKATRLVPTEVKDEKGTVTRKLIFKENPKKLRSAPSIMPGIALACAEIGRIIAEHYGMDMDIEIVFDPENQELSIVQARPIPEGISHKTTPSAIAPEKWKEIKKDPTIQKIKSPVISPAGYEAKVVTTDRVILDSTISSALNTYLKKTAQRENSDTIIVKNPSPSTSHEAAQLNLLGVSVFQGPIEVIEKWLKDNKSIVIADTQHQHLVKLTKKIPSQKDLEKELKEDKIIVEGMFSSSLSTCETLLPTDVAHTKIITSTIKKYLSTHTKIKSNHIYETLLDCIETIEGAKNNNSNKEAFAALQTMADIFKAIGTSTKAQEKNTPHKKLCVYAIQSIAEIDHCLSTFSKLSENSNLKMTQQHELLDLISKLKALVINPGEANLYSDSIKQMAMHNKELDESKIKDEKLTESQQSYLNEFLKCKTLALNETTRESWTRFSVYCAKKPLTQQMLSQIILFCIENNIPSELINNHFIRAFKRSQTEHNPSESVLVELYKMIDQSKKEFSRYKINENNQIISSWENQVNNWNKPDKFEKLYNEFNIELAPLISRISLDEKMSNLTQEIILKQVLNLAEVIDKSIKAMKGSMDYQGQENLLVERFVKLLIPYHELMKKWMNAIPSDFYDKCAAEISKDKAHNKKEAMISIIEEVFNEKKRTRSADQLNASGYLSVASAKVGTNASITRQFVENRSKLTLEDLFSYFHQNILASVGILGKKSIISCEDLPEKIQPILSKISKIQNIDLLSINHHYPVVEIEFNIPLDNHSAKLILEYNTKTKSLTLNGKIFGRNWNQRMTIISKIAEIEGLLVGDVVQKPFYNENSRILEFGWEFNDNQIDYLSSHIDKILSHYILLTDYNRLEVLSDDLSTNCLKLWNRHCNPTIPKDLFQKLSLERSQLIGEKIQEITNNLLFNEFSKNPVEIFPFLGSVEKINTVLFFNNISALTFEVLEKLIDKYGLKLDLSERFIDLSLKSRTFLGWLMSEWSSSDAIQFILKYKPDLTNEDELINDVITKHPDIKLLQLLFTQGALFNLFDLKYAFNQPALKPFAIKQLEKWDNEKLLSWVYSQSTYPYFSPNDREFLFEFLEQFKDKVDFNSYIKKWFLDNQETISYDLRVTLKQYLSKYSDLSFDPEEAPADVALDSLENMLKFAFANTNLKTRIQNIDISTLMDLETHIEFLDKDAPLTVEQKDFVIDFFQKLGLERWRITIHDPCKVYFIEHNARIDLFLNKDAVQKLLKEYVNKQIENAPKNSFSQTSPSSFFKFFKPKPQPGFKLTNYFTSAEDWQLQIFVHSKPGQLEEIAAEAIKRAVNDPDKEWIVNNVIGHCYNRGMKVRIRNEFENAKISHWEQVKKQRLRTL